MYDPIGIYFRKLWFEILPERPYSDKTYITEPPWIEVTSVSLILRITIPNLAAPVHKSDND